MKKIVLIVLALLAVSVSINAILLKDAADARWEYELSRAGSYDAAFNGKVVEVAALADGGEVVTFQITKPIRHSRAGEALDLESRATIDVVSDDLHAHCVMDFKPGIIYTVYSRFKSGALITNACWGTHPWNDSGSINLPELPGTGWITP